MQTQFKLGDKVKSRRGYRPRVRGRICRVLDATADIQLLWGAEEVRYQIIADNGDVTNVIERGIEKA